jgi:hypothetical protein
VGVEPFDGFAQGHAGWGLWKSKFSHGFPWVKELVAAREADLVRRGRRCALPT